MKKIIFLFVITACFSNDVAFADNSAKIVNKANRYYGQRRYEEALELYNKAKAKRPDCPEIDFNIGATHYRKGEYQPAIDSFEKAAAAADKRLEEKANFNIGNSKYKLGKLKEDTDLSGAAQLLRESLDYYKRAMALDQRDKAPKVNYDLVEKELKALLEKLKQQKEQQKQQKSGQNQEDKQKQEAGQGSGQQKEEEAKSEENKESQKEAGQKQAGQKQEAQKEETTAQQEAKLAQKPEEMSKKEADMLLEGFRDEENTFGKLEDKKRGRLQDVLKDW